MSDTKDVHGGSRKSLSELLREATKDMEADCEVLREDIRRMNAKAEEMRQQLKDRADFLSDMPPVKKFLEERGLSHFDELDNEGKEILQMQLDLLNEATRKGKTEIDFH